MKRRFSKSLSFVLVLLMVFGLSNTAYSTAFAQAVDEEEVGSFSGDFGFANAGEYTVDSPVSASQDKFSPVKLAGKRSFNLDANDYPLKSSCMFYNDNVNSYLSEKVDNTLERVEYCYDTNDIVVENYSKNGSKLLSSRTIEMELPIFGGYYCGAEYNFFVFGENNEDEDNSKEIMRVVKYSKDWNRIGSCSLKGLDTRIPFYDGSLDMAESNGTLYVHTCHQMYSGYQENISLAFDENKMELKESDYHNKKKVGITTYYSTGSVYSHLMEADSSDVFFLTHEALIPVGVTIAQVPSGDAMKKKKTSTVIDLSKSAEIKSTNTGISVGGFEITEKNCLIAFNGVDYQTDNFEPNGVRNVYFMVTDRGLTKSKSVKLTDYTDKKKIKVGTPQMVKINSDKFLLLWEEFDHQNRTAVTKLALIDSSGKVDSQGIVSTNYCLSDCQPILCSDNLVRWYTGMDDSPTLYTVDPFSLKLSEENTPQSLDVELNIILNLGDTFVIPYFHTERVAGRGTTASADFSKCINGDFSFSAKNYCSGKLQVLLEHRTIIYNITVEKPVTEIIISKNKLDLEVNQSETLFAVVQPTDATDLTVTWKSSNPSVAVVDNGKVTGKSKGSARITATASNGITAACDVNVDVYPRSVSLDKDELEMEVNDSVTLKAVVSPADADNTIRWVSSDESVAKVENGKVKALSLGTADINAVTRNNISASCRISVLKPAPRLTSATNQLEGGVLFEWECDKNAEGYRVFRKTKSGGWDVVADVSADFYSFYGESPDYHFDTQVENGKEYTYTVREITEYGDIVSKCDPNGISVTYHNYPCLSTIESSGGGIKLSWDAVYGSVSYRVYRKDSKGEWQRLTTTDKTSFVDTNVKKDGKYTYTLRCIGFDGEFYGGYNKNGWTYTYMSSQGILGDVNNDGTVNTKDRIVLARYLAKRSGYDKINTANSDVNADGTVDAKDRIVLARYLAKWRGYSSLPHLQ